MSAHALQIARPALRLPAVMTQCVPRLQLRGRRRECEALGRLLGGVGQGHSGVVVLRGEPGVGKTALLDYLVARSTGFRILRAAGAEFEMELAFAGLHQLCAPMLAGLARLPDQQRDALATAFGLSCGDAPDRFTVGLAALSLLSEAAEQQPLLCVVDDAQWLDRASAEALAFVARRVLAEPIALVFAKREPSKTDELGRLPELEVGGLGDADARAMFDSAIRGPMDPRVRDRIVREARGNPLALLELPRGLMPAELAGGVGLPDTMPMASRIERSFARQILSLPSETQRLLLVAAAEPIGDITLLWRAAERLGIALDAAEPAVTAGLIELGVRTRFRHPLVRSAVCRAAPAGELQAVHRALADATDAETDPDRRAWHRAQGAVGPDETVARELENCAARVQRRGGVAAAAAFLARATELTPDPAGRASRALVAAQAKLDAAAPDAASELLATAEMGPLDELQRARLERLRAKLAFGKTRGSNAAPSLLAAAKWLEPVDAKLARATYLDALGAAICAGRRSTGGGVVGVAEAARGAPAAPWPRRPTDLLLDALSTRFTEPYARAVRPLRHALNAFAAAEDHDGDAHVLWLAWRVAPDLWDDELWHPLAIRAVRLARDAGHLSALPIALTYRACVQVHAGDFDAAAGLIDEADAISAAAGSAPLWYTSLVLAAWRGQESPALDLIARGLDDATVRGEGRAIALAHYATAVLYNGLGRYEDALAAAQRVCAYEDLGLFGWALLELVEAGTRSDNRDAAHAALLQLDERARVAGTDWALGIQARSSALLNAGEASEALYREALERLARTRITVHLARAHLLYGEWLRRENRRVDARKQLRAAHEMFCQMGAEAFAERARRELSATGETARKRTADTFDELTTQELQVARLAAEGHTNPEIGAELFISPRTAEYHLRKVFTKLGISSRKELRASLPPRRTSPPSIPALGTRLGRLTDATSAASREADRHTTSDVNERVLGS
jgi:DNA-binding CsgD family transcriptional regulator/tetratricopeptide (TPR) repeat protein